MLFSWPYGEVEDVGWDHNYKWMSVSGRLANSSEEEREHSEIFFFFFLNSLPLLFQSKNKKKRISNEMNVNENHNMNYLV